MAKRRAGRGIHGHGNEGQTVHRPDYTGEIGKEKRKIEKSDLQGAAAAEAFCPACLLAVAAMIQRPINGQIRLAP